MQLFQPLWIIIVYYNLHQYEVRIIRKAVSFWRTWKCLCVPTQTPTVLFNCIPANYAYWVNIICIYQFSLIHLHLILYYDTFMICKFLTQWSLWFENISCGPIYRGLMCCPQYWVGQNRHRSIDDIYWWVCVYVCVCVCL